MKAIAPARAGALAVMLFFGLGLWVSFSNMVQAQSLGSSDAPKYEVECTVWPSTRRAM